LEFAKKSDISEFCSVSIRRTASEFHISDIKGFYISKHGERQVCETRSPPNYCDSFPEGWSKHHRTREK